MYRTLQSIFVYYALKFAKYCLTEIDLGYWSQMFLL